MKQSLYFFVLPFVTLACTAQKSEKISLPKDEPQEVPSVKTTQETTPTPNVTPTAVVEVKPPAPIIPPPESKSRVSGTIVASKLGQASFEIAGHIEKTFANVGDKVTKGQTIATLRNADHVLRLRSAKAQVELSQINTDQAKKDLERENQLKREGATTQTNFERFTNLLSSSQIALAQAQIALQQAQNQISYTKLLASYDGVVSKRIKVEGEWVGIGNSVYEISALGEVEVSLRMPESLLRKVTVGQKIPVTIPSLELKTEMIIHRIVPVIQENSRTFELIGKLPTSISNVFPGQFVEAEF